MKSKNINNNKFLTKINICYTNKLNNNNKFLTKINICYTNKEN
jgi:hypothetical protein